MVMLKDKFPIKSTILLVILILVSTVCVSLSVMNKEEKNSKDAVTSFLSQINKFEVSRTEIFYYSWGVVTSAAVSEKSILDGKYHIKITEKMQDTDIPRLEKALNNFKYEKKEIHHEDCRMVFVYYSIDNKEVLRLTLLKNYPVVLINGSPYKMSSDLFISMIEFLPKNIYDSVIDDITRTWISTLSSSQKSEIKN